ncbi:MAG: M14 family metallopeptidase [bacterium]
MKQLLLCLVLLPLFLFSQSSLQSPEQAFGFKVGTDQKLIDWTQIHSYFTAVDKQSGRVIVQELGKTTLGKPFIMAIISSEATIKNLDHYQSLQRQLAKPYSLSADATAKMIEEGKSVVLVTMNIHSTEIASSQESVELLYELATSTTPKIKKILDNVIILMIPSLNPDGQQMVADWYKQTVGTPAEGTAPPQLYHHYAGHDNNRDWFMYNLIESRLTAKVLYHDWFPEIVYDQHQMGSGGARLFLPPYTDPVNPNIPPALSAQTSLLGKFMTSAMHAEGYKGVLNGVSFNAFFEGTMSKTPLWHNRIGILSEMASVNIASPIFFPKSSVRVGQRSPDTKIQNDYLAPWEGGWWRLRDIIEYEKTATYACLEFAASLKEQVKTTFYRLNREAIDKGKKEAPFGYLFPIDQHDPNAAALLINRLMISGVDAQQTNAPITIAGRIIPKGSFYISLAQPCRPYIKDLMEAQRYPNLYQYPGGPPERPYDVTAWTMPMQMGVELVPLKQKIEIAAHTITTAVVPIPALSAAKAYLVERRFLNSYGFVHALLKNNIPVFETLGEAYHDGHRYPIGTFYIPSESKGRASLEKFAREREVPMIPINSELKGAEPGKEMKREIRWARLAVYQPLNGNMDEGWTRCMLDQFKIAYTSLRPDDFKKKDFKLHNEFDVILFPEMSSAAIVSGAGGGRPGEEEPVLGTPQRPKEYAVGIGQQGVDMVKEFISSGGTVLTLGNASEFAIERFRLPIVNELKNVSSKEFFAPGSIFETMVDLSHPLTYGMEEKAYIYFDGSPAFRMRPYNRESSVVLSYGDSNPLRSGWLLGAELLYDKVAMAEIPVDKGRVILYGFRVQHRAQTTGTYKLLLNALVISK